MGHGRPPEPQFNEGKGVVEAGVTDKFRQMPPLKNLNRIVRWAITWIWLCKLWLLVEMSLLPPHRKRGE